MFSAQHTITYTHTYETHMWLRHIQSGISYFIDFQTLYVYNVGRRICRNCSTDTRPQVRECGKDGRWYESTCLRKQEECYTGIAVGKFKKPEYYKCNNGKYSAFLIIKYVDRHCVNELSPRSMFMCCDSKFCSYIEACLTP